MKHLSKYLLVALCLVGVGCNYSTQSERNIAKNVILKYWPDADIIGTKGYEFIVTKDGKKYSIKFQSYQYSGEHNYYIFAPVPLDNP